jgi:hypothetical protein
MADTPTPLTQSAVVREKRDKRVWLCVTETQLLWLQRLAVRDRVDPATKAWQIIADVHEGKLVRAPESEVAA